MPLRVKLLLFISLLSTPSWALVAAFPIEIHDRTVLGIDEPTFLANETPDQQKRPVWLQGGDSISTGWSSGTTLRERLARAENGELPRPGSLRDNWRHFPSVDNVWYAGRELGYGVFGWLERQTQEPWVLISVARVGARFQGKRADPLEAMSSIQSLARVKVVTFSLGGNDLCRASHVVDDPAQFVKRLEDFKARLPQGAVVAALEVPDVVKIRRTVMDRLEALPDSIGKTRLLDYCHVNWDVKNCEAATQVPQAKLEQMRQTIEDSLVQVFGGVVNTDRIANNMDPLDMMAEDCFHPSRLAQKPLAEAIESYIAPRLRMD
jgi:hypothetical protein